MNVTGSEVKPALDVPESLQTKVRTIMKAHGRYHHDSKREGSPDIAKNNLDSSRSTGPIIDLSIGKKIESPQVNKIIAVSQIKNKLDKRVVDNQSPLSPISSVNDIEPLSAIKLNNKNQPSINIFIEDKSSVLKKYKGIASDDSVAGSLMQSNDRLSNEVATPK